MSNFKGWSLLEVLIAVTVAALAGGLLINLLVSSGKLFVDQSAQISQGLSLNQTQLELTELIKSSSGIATQYPAQGTPQYITDQNTLVLKLPGITSGGDVTDVFFDYAVIEADPGKPAILRKQIFKDSQSFRNSENKVLSVNLSSLSFSYLDINNNAVTPGAALRVSFIINLSTISGFSQKESSSSGTVNLKNI